jgi:hypothetical protein
MGGLRCRACRRYILRPTHVFILTACGVAAVIALLDLLEH